MDYYLFRIKADSSLAKAKKELKKAGLQAPFVIEEEGTILLGGYSPIPIDLLSLKTVELIEEKAAEIDWENQWSQFAENFSEGKAHIDLSRFGTLKTLLLLPGAGFGDLSHPTTFLLLKMMQDKVQEESILDLGTGSGILALASLLMGAKQAIGIDIDEQALVHAKANAHLNHLEEKVRFFKERPDCLEEGQIGLINMIFPEQKILQPAQYNPQVKLWLVSGILKQQRKAYLIQAKEWGWKPIEEHILDEWMGWVFEKEEIFDFFNPKKE